MTWNRRFKLISLSALVLLGRLSVYACPNCYGNPEEPETKGLTMAVLTLLGITGGVLGSFAYFFVVLRKRENGNIP